MTYPAGRFPTNHIKLLSKRKSCNRRELVQLLFSSKQTLRRKNIAQMKILVYTMQLNVPMLSNKKMHK